MLSSRTNLPASTGYFNNNNMLIASSHTLGTNSSSSTWANNGGGQSLFLTPVRTPATKGANTSTFRHNDHQNLAWTRSSNLGSSSFGKKAEQSADDGKDRCEHQASMYRRKMCEHCGEKFCDSCEIPHKEKIKRDIFKMGQANYDLDQEGIENSATSVREHLNTFTEMVRNNVEAEIASTELKFQKAARTFLMKLRAEGDDIIAKAGDLRDAELNDLKAIGFEAVRCHEDKVRVSTVLDWLQKEPIFFVTLGDMAQLHRECIRYYGLSCAIDALRSTADFYSDKPVEFLMHPGFVPMLDRCVEFFRTAQLGSVKFSSPIRKIREMVSGNHNFDTSPFKPLLNTPPASSDSPKFEYIGKSFYDRMHVTAMISGKDAVGWDIRKPFGLIWLTNTEYLAVVHRPKRITLVNVKGEVIATYKFVDPDCRQSGGLNFHGNLAADDKWKIYFIDEPGLRIFSFDVKANPSNEDMAVPHVFTRLHSSSGGRSAMTLSQFTGNNSDVAFCNKMKFHGLAVGLARRELYTEAGDSIVGFDLADGCPKFRCLLEPSHQFSSHVLGVLDRPSSISYLIYSTSHGNVLHKKTFCQNGLLEEGSAVIAYQGCEMNCVNEVRGVASDPSGNLLLADSKNGCIKVFSENFHAFSSFGYGDISTFNPSGVAIAIGSNGQPVIVVTEFSSHRIIFFSA